MTRLHPMIAGRSKVAATRPLLTILLFAVVAAISVFYPVFLGETLGGHVDGAAPFEQFHRPSDTSALGDVEVAMLPFLAHAEREYRAGRVPLWNPYAGLGAPLLANQQSAVFHPITLVGLLFGWRRALLVAALFRWLLAFSGGYLLARDLDMDHIASLCTALSFALSGCIIGWLCYPVGSVIAHLPLLMFLARLHGRTGSPRALAWLVTTLVSSLLAGHFEYLPVLWLVTAGAWCFSRHRRPGWALPVLVGIFATSLLVSAVFLLPCVEYLAQSSAITRRANAARHGLSDARLLATAIDGTLHQAPRTAELFRHKLHPILSAENYFGVIGLLLAAIGARRRKSRATVVWVAASLLLLVENPASSLVLRLPPFCYMDPDKLVFLVAMALSVLAGLGIEGAGRSGSAPAAALGLLLAAAVTSLEGKLFAGFSSVPSPARFLPIAGGAVACLLIAAGSGSPRLLRILLLSLLLLERAFALSSFNRWDRPERIFPELPLIHRLRGLAGHDRVIAPGSSLSPDSATVYGLRDARLYDAIGVASYERLLLADGDAHPWGARHLLPSRSSRLAGARIVLYPDNFESLVEQPDVSGRSRELCKGVTVTGSHLARGGRLQSLWLHFRKCRPPLWPCIVELHRNGPSGTLLFKTRLRARWLPLNRWKRIPVEPEVATRKGEHLSIVVRSPCDVPGTGFILSRARIGRDDRSGKLPEHKMGPLALKVGYLPADLLRTVDRIGTLTIAIDPGAEPRARLARSAGSVRFEQDASTHVVLNVSLRHPDQLILADAVYPGWSVKVDGKARGINRASSLRRVPLSKGKHHVQFIYSPMSYRLGLFLSLASLMAIAGAKVSARGSWG